MATVGAFEHDGNRLERREWDQGVGAGGATHRFTTGLPAVFQPSRPSPITATLVYPALTARRAASWEAIQSRLEQ